MTQTFTVIVEQGEDGYLISEVVELPGCRSQAKTQDKLIERTKEAISLYLEMKGTPENKTKFLGLQQVEIEAKDVAKVLQKLGFEFKRQKGSHMFFAHPDGRTTVIPNHPTEHIA